MDEVWVLVRTRNGAIRGVYSTREKAEMEKTRAMAINPNRDYEILPFLVDKSPEFQNLLHKER